MCKTLSSTSPCTRVKRRLLLPSLVITRASPTLRQRAQESIEVEIFREAPDDTYYYGSCPKCGTQFDYDKWDVGRTVRCRQCNAPMKLVETGEEDET